MFRSRSAATVFKAAGTGFLSAILCSCTGASSSKNKIEQILQQYHRNGKFSGSALVGYRDTVVYQGAFGLADETWKIANTPATRFQIGSLTKQFTAALILELAQQGRLNLDATLSIYLPEYRRDVADAVTIRELLGHSAGVPDFVHRSDIMQIVKEPATPQEVISNYCSDALEFTPGTQFKYSNCGYLILGALYQQVTGETYADGLRRLTTRAGVTDTDISGPRAIVPRLATAYVFENGQQIKAPYIDWSVAFSSGAVYSTVQDLWRWRGELLAGRVLGEKGTKEIFALRPFGYSFGWHVGRTNQAQLRTFLASDYDAQPAPDSADLLLASHSGDLPGFHSCMTLFLDRTWTVILLDNHDNKSLPNLAAEIINALLTRTPEARSTSAP
ncbi:MAG: serine hydrolase domain-containing protein [Candidatus Udaeobacter sp.]